MMKKPVLKAKVSDKDFRDWISSEADKLARWVDLSVSAFAADPKAKAERLRKVRDPETGYQYFWKPTCRTM